MKRLIVIILAALVLAGGVFYLYRDALMRSFFAPTASSVPAGETEEPLAPETIVENLEIPWEIVFLPDGDLLVTERPGRLLRIGAQKSAIEISGVAHRGEGGLLGLALHPDFEDNGWIYLYLTTAESGGLTNRVERYVLRGTSLSERTLIIEGIPGAQYHDGGRVRFGPDGYLYITTGDAGNEASAQDTESLAGKILRLRDDGAIPEDNPFDNAVYSYGHRNPQGLAWDQRGQLWATEHGRSGAQSGFDELNNIDKGVNYGWPSIQGAQMAASMRAPAIHSGASETWAPGGAVYFDGHILFVGLRGESLYAAEIDGGEVRDITAYLRGEYGRLRTVALGPEGMLYILTSNRDGRGTPARNDDRIIRIDPASLGL
jgi:glucose/arabinose dehydrogenase